jgi:penicillin-binding protein 2
VAEHENNTRLRWLLGISLLLVVGLWVRLFELQVLRTAEFRQKSDANSIRLVEELPGRGLIVDRHGRVIVENKPSYSLSVIPSEIRHSSSTLLELAQILNQSEDTIIAELPTRGVAIYQPTKLARDINFSTLAALKARYWDLVGVSYQFEPKRSYPYMVAPHLLGYIGEISEAEKKRFPNRIAGDIVGKQGVERKYDDLLAGQKGFRFLEVNALGQIIGELTQEYIPPRSSGKLYLTLDLELQYLAEELMTGKTGALVAMDPNTGEILAMVSQPEYNLDDFAGVLRSDIWQALQADPGVPLLNRATQSGYPAGSTYKPMILAAAIEEGIVTLDTRIFCSGGYNLGRVYHCFKKEGHGTVDPLMSIEQSCDVFYYTLGHKLGAERLGKYQRMFGFGQRTGIDIENEVKGCAPDKKFFDKKFGVNAWSPGLTLNVAIGQGEVLATPLQLAHYCSIMATAGLDATPHLFLKTHQEDLGMIEYEPQVRHVDIKPETFALVREGMRRVVEGSGGTARRFKDPRWQLAGKTGTAQNPHGDDHSLFIGFGPFEKPIIAVAVVVENGGFGSQVAAPIATSIINRYIEIQVQPDSVSHLADSLLVKLNEVGLYPTPLLPSVADSLKLKPAPLPPILQPPAADVEPDLAD